MNTTGTAPHLFLGPDARIVRAVEDVDTTTSRKWAVALRQISYSGFHLRVRVNRTRMTRIKRIYADLF